MTHTAALRNNTLGRQWRAGTQIISLLHFPLTAHNPCLFSLTFSTPCSLPFASPTPCAHQHTHNQDHQGKDAGEPEESDALDSFVLRFQKIFVQEKNKKWKKLPAKGPKILSQLSSRLYEPFHTKNQEMKKKHKDSNSDGATKANSNKTSNYSITGMLKAPKNYLIHDDKTMSNGKAHISENTLCIEQNRICSCDNSTPVALGEKMDLQAHSVKNASFGEPNQVHSSDSFTPEALRGEKMGLQTKGISNENNHSTDVTSSLKHTQQTNDSSHRTLEQHTQQVNNIPHITVHHNITASIQGNSDTLGNTMESRAHDNSKKDSGTVEGETLMVNAEKDGERKLSWREHSLLHLVIDSAPKCNESEELKKCARQNVIPTFDVLLRVCAGASRTDAATLVTHVQRLIQGLYPQQYQQHLALDYYLASSLCYGGEMEKSLAVLLHLYRQSHPERNKKVNDTTRFILFRLVEAGEEHLSLALDFVGTVASELNYEGPALSLWNATFTSPLYRIQQVSESLLDQYKGLVRMIERKMSGMVERAAWEGNLTLLHRLLQLALQHRLKKHYSAITSALLQLQCDLGDLKSAEETIKFSQKMGVRVKPVSLQRFLALLSQHRRPAPRALLALKYQPLPKRPKYSPPPTFKYKF